MRLIVLAFSLLLLVGCEQTPEKAARKFIGLLHDGKHKELQLMLTERLQSKYKESGIHDGNIKRYYRSNMMKYYDLEALEVTETKARYRVSVETNEGEKHSGTIALQKVGEDWKVSRF